MSFVIYNNLYFTTCTIHKWQNLLDDQNKDIVLNSFAFLVKQKRLSIYAFVIMPNHLHVLWEIFEPTDMQHVIHSFQSFTAKELLLTLDDERRKDFCVDKLDRKFQIWKSSPLSVEIVNPKFLKQKMKYIHENPVRASLVDDNYNYFYSSYKSYIDGIAHFDFLSFIL